MTFRERLEIVLQGRKLTPWAKSLGLSASFIARANDNKTPNSDALATISRVERVSISWLLTGQGNPFLVTSCLDDDEFAELLSELAGESFALLLLNDPAAPDENPVTVAIVQIQASVEIKGKEHHYLHYEVINCNLVSGGGAIKIIEDQYPNTVWDEMLDKDMLNSIAQGKAGNELLEYVTGNSFDETELDEPTDFDFDAEEKYFVQYTSEKITSRIIKDFTKIKELDSQKAQQIMSELVKIISS